MATTHIAMYEDVNGYNKINYTIPNRRNSKEYKLKKQNIFYNFMIFIGQQKIPNYLQLILISFVSVVVGFLLKSFCDRSLHKNYDFHDKNLTMERVYDTRIATDLYNKINVLCWIKTMPGHEDNVKAIRNTWGKRCNTLLFISSENNTELGIIGVPVMEGRNNLWIKVELSYKYIYDNYLTKADWFLKTDDDTYVIMENLRYMLTAYSPAHPYYGGGRIKSEMTPSFMSGGAGYVMSRAALKLFIEESLPNPEKCSKNPVDDATIGQCLYNVNVSFIDTRDFTGRERFYPFEVEYHIFPGPIEFNWYTRLKYYDSVEGFGNMTFMPISFHYIKPLKQYAYDYLIYNVRPYGIIREKEFQLPEKVTNSIGVLEEVYPTTITPSVK